MDSIFQKSKSIFDVVGIARREPHRYDKNGNVLIQYEETEAHTRRKSSVAYQDGAIPRRLSTASGASEKQVSGHKEGV